MTTGEIQRVISKWLRRNVACLVSFLRSVLALVQNVSDAKKRAMRLR